MKSNFAGRLEAISGIRGVVGTMVVGESDGLIVDSLVQTAARADVVAALAASLYRRTRLAAGTTGLGSAGFLQLDAEGGRLFASGVPGGDLVIVAVADTRANVGMIRMEMLRGVKGLK
jgi:predicted regulator of Ras-like GTPase activity (Roadblock/LC7/MglB family)